jgi:hypothetical protein
VELARDEKEVKGAYRIKRIIRDQWCLTTREIKGEGKGNCLLRFQARMLKFLW